MQKTSQVTGFADTEDELLLWREIQQAVPQALLLDQTGRRMPLGPDVLVEDPSRSAAVMLHIWSPVVEPDLLTAERLVDPARTGAGTIKWERCHGAEGTLRDGRLAVRWDSDVVVMTEFVQAVMKVARRVLKLDLEFLDGTPETRLRVGPHTREAALAGDVTLLGSSRVPSRYQVRGSAAR